MWNSCSVPEIVIYYLDFGQIQTLSDSFYIIYLLIIHKKYRVCYGNSDLYKISKGRTWPVKILLLRTTFEFYYFLIYSINTFVLQGTSLSSEYYGILLKILQASFMQ